MSAITKLPITMTWGIDVSKVILRDVSETMPYELEDYSAEEIAQYAKFVPGAVNAVKTLIKKFGSDNIWLLCKANDKQKKIFRASLSKLDFYRQTGFKKEQLIFVSDSEDKAVVASSLELKGYIDDRGAAIHAVQKNVQYPFWFAPTAQEVEQWVKKMKYSVRVVSGWKQFVEINLL